MSHPRAYKCVTLATSLLTLALLMLLVASSCKREPPPPRLLAAPTPEPPCILCGTDPVTGAQAICCKRDVAPHLFVEAEMRDGDTVIESRMIETFVQAVVTPTIDNRFVFVSVPISEFVRVGDLWLNARYAYDPLDLGLTTGWVDEGGNVLPQDNGFSLYGAFYRFYMQLLQAVVQ